jgi:hypothetical protein
MAEAGDASEHEKITPLEAENPFPDGDPRHQLWKPFWAEVRESLGPRIQELARRDEEVCDALHKYLKTPSEDRPHLWEASLVPWLRKRQPRVEWPDTAPTENDAVHLLLEATAEDPKMALPRRLPELAQHALEKFIKDEADLKLYAQILPRIEQLTRTSFNQAWAAVLARKVARGELSSEQVASRLDSDADRMAEVILGWQDGWLVKARAYVAPQAPRATATAGSYEEHKQLRKANIQPSIDYYALHPTAAPTADDIPVAEASDRTPAVADEESTEAISGAAPEPAPPRVECRFPLDVQRIKAWMEAEGYDGPQLAEVLHLSERAISSMLNAGTYHGRKAVNKLANRMGIEDWTELIDPATEVNPT